MDESTIFLTVDRSLFVSFFSSSDGGGRWTLSSGQDELEIKTEKPSTSKIPTALGL